MKTLYIVNGFPRSGKDTFMDQCVYKFGNCGLITKKHSTIDTSKDILRKMGWDGEKTPEMRCALSELKDLYTKYFDGPLNEIKYLMTGTPLDILFVAMREPEEIKKTVKWGFKAGFNVHTVLIRGQFEEIDHTSHSDYKVLDYDYGLEFSNYDTKEDFLQKIDLFVNYMIKQSKYY